MIILNSIKIHRGWVVHQIVDLRNTRFWLPREIRHLITRLRVHAWLTEKYLGSENWGIYAFDMTSGARIEQFGETFFVFYIHCPLCVGF